MTTTASITPDLDWFTRRWKLPGEARPFVNDYLEAERAGSTALPLPPGTDADLFADAAVVAFPGAEPPPRPRPFVVIRNGRRLFLQSWRNYQAEVEIARRLRTRLNGGFDARCHPDRLKQFFPGAKKGDLQVKAAELAIRNRLTLITGGPGTGKTHTLVRILALLLDQGIAPSKIRLAAPTGKAADRMKKAVGESLAALPPGFQPRTEDLRVAANNSSTIHSLLGYNPAAAKRGHDQAHPLPCDALIIDECSMVDVLLWRALLEATPENARLILVGDPNQLESVGQGNVFAELVRVAKNSASPLHARWVHLAVARRFKNRRGILALAAALENLDAAEAVNLLSAAKGPTAAGGIAWLDISGASLTWSDFPEPIRRALTAVAEAATPEAAMAALGRICILTAQREYFVGSKALNEAIERHFAATGAHNQPIIINQNDPETRLRNGSVGIIAPGADGVRRARFPASGGAGSFQEFSVAQLPDFSPAWAMTIHRSQGSEFDEVLVLLPRQESPMTTRELIYTAITRARNTVYIAGDIESIRKAAATPSRRITMLGAHLEQEFLTLV